MTATVLWLACFATLAGGYAYGAAADPADASAIASGVIALVGLAAVSAVMAWAVPAWRYRGTILALVVAGLARGLSEGSHGATVSWLQGRGDNGVGVLFFEVLEASWPGGSCQVRAQTPSAVHPVWLSLPVETCPLAEGDDVVVPLSSFRLGVGSRWPGDADGGELALARGAFWVGQSKYAWPSQRSGAGYWSFVARMRQRAWDHSRGDDGVAFVISSLFGVRGAISPEARRHLAAAGLGHLIAVSGMQVSLIAWLIFRIVLRAIGAWRGSVLVALFLSMIPVLGYVGLCGAEAPCVRAAIMVLATGLGMSVGRPAHGLTVLLWTSVVMLAARPAWCFDIGFQLSVAAMAALVRAPDSAGLVLQSWRVSWAIAPILVWHFGETGAWAVPANFFAVPVFSLWVTPLGIAAVPFAAWLGPSAWQPAAWGASLVLDVAHIFAALPEIPVAVLGLLAALVLFGTPWRECLPVCARHWLPSSLVCAATVGAWWVRTTVATPQRPSTQWFVQGNPRRATILARHPGDPTIACIKDPNLAIGAWPNLLRELGLGTVAEIQWTDRRRQAGPVDFGVPPHVVEVRAALDHDGQWRPVAGCVYPDVAKVRQALRFCRRQSGQSSVFAAVANETVSCYRSGHWSPVGR